MPDFDLNVWNANAEAQLLAEYQARDAVNTTTNVFSRGPSSGSTSQSPGTGGGTSLGSRPLKSISSTMANVIICELPAVFSADDRIGAVKVLIGKVVASVAVTLSAECAAELERELLGQCEHIAANCAASDGERQAAENVKVRDALLCIASFYFDQVSIHSDPPESRCLPTVLHPSRLLSRLTHSPLSGSTLPVGSGQPPCFRRL